MHLICGGKDTIFWAIHPGDRKFDNRNNCHFFAKNNYYGIPKNLAGQKARFILSIKCNFEIISFDDEFFIKTYNL